MNIVVSIKAVPDTIDVKFDPETGTLIREGISLIINPFDMYAIEEALRVKDKTGGKVTLITMGPPNAVDALKEGISYGVDDCIHLCDRAFAGSDTLATSHILASAVRKMDNVDLVLFGKQAMDGDTAQVGPGVAEWLGIPFVAFAGRLDINDDNSVTVHRMTETGHDVIEMPLPGVVTVVKEINEPRMPSLKGKLRAKKYEPVMWGVDDIGVDHAKIGLDSSPTTVVKIFSPKIDRQSEILKGESTKEIVETLCEKLKEAHVL